VVFAGKIDWVYLAGIRVFLSSWIPAKRSREWRCNG